MIIIGITGTLGSGKGTIVDYLVKEKGFKHYSVRDFLVDEIKKRGLEINRDSMVNVANELRAQKSPHYIIEELYKKAESLGTDSVIESIRTEGEVDFLKSKPNFYLFAVDAEPEKRYERIILRQSETDKISFEKFMADEWREFKSDDPNKQNLSKCISLADYVFNNDGKVGYLFSQVENVLQEIQDR